MKVLKFGGTSVGTVKNILQVKKIVESQDEPIIVVVSALGGVTDNLLNLSAKAAAGDRTYLDDFEAIEKRHYDSVDLLLLEEEQPDVNSMIASLFEELGNILRGVFLIHELSQRSSDIIVTYGERLSSLIISRVLKGSQLIDAQSLIKTERVQGREMVDFPSTNKLIVESFESLPQISVVPGFISSNHQGETTTLGRGGSDYTAAILAAALNANFLEIWTDVDGFMTADPRVIKKAYTIGHLSYAESMELSHFGAKVIYPPTIYPVYLKGVPIKIKNTQNPEGPGTIIDKKNGHSDRMIKGISSINDTCLITMQGLGMVGVIGINDRLFGALASQHVSVFLVSQASSESSTTFAIKSSDAETAVAAIREVFHKEFEQGEINRITVEKEMATVAIVGENMKHTPGIAGKLFNTLGKNGINVVAIAQGASEQNISFVVKESSLRKALNVIHEAFFLSEYSELNLFLVGVGTVGSDLLSQLEKQQPKLLRDNRLRIRVAGLANSRKCIFNRDGINLSQYPKLLEDSDCAMTLESFREEIVNMNMFNSVFVDCTASEDVAGIYKELLAHNIHIVTANKVAASSEFKNYKELKNLAQSKGVKFLFETNVGAGLPIINTMNDLIKSGDKIIKLEAVLSGTLNFIFNTISSEIPLSRAIEMAKEAGYSEPDPRIDLSGVDVIRKLVILSREAGHAIEKSDVKMSPFISETCFEGDIENFWEQVKALNGEFEERRKVLESEGKRWRFVARFEEGAADVELRAVEHTSPFYDLEGSNNVILIKTERYHEYPMQIKGYGAGASVTAAGVFADIIRIANP